MIFSVSKTSFQILFGKKDFDQLRSSFNSSDLEMEIMNKYPLRLLDLSPDLKQMNQAPPNFSPLLKELDEE